MPKIEKREKRIAWIVSIFLGAAITITALVTLWNKLLFEDYLFCAVVITIFPSAVLDYFDYRWRRSVDQSLPAFFENVVQAKKTGVALPQALEKSCKESHGPLTAELKKTMAQISWGAPLEKTFYSLGERVDTKMTQQAVALLVGASRFGGRIERVFDPLGRFLKSNIYFEKKRQTQMRPYVAIVYIAYFVFLFTIIMLFRVFFNQMMGFPNIGLALLTASEIKSLFFHMSTIQAFFSGLIAGKMGEGTLSAGLKHSVILASTGYLALKLMM